MRKQIGMIGVFLCIAFITVAGCTSSKEPVNATPQIVYVTVLVTPTPTATTVKTIVPEVSSPALSQETRMDEEFIDYLNSNQIYEAMTALKSATPGSYSISTGYNAQPKEEASRLTSLLYTAPKPGSENMKAYRSALMDALAEMDGTTAGFSRYNDAMEKVVLAKNAVQANLHAAGSSSVDAIHLNGHGNDVRSFNVTKTGVEMFSMHHTGDSNFAITLKDEDGNYIALLVNEIGEYTGKNSERLAIGKYYLNIEADGDWTISITSG